MSSDPPRLLDEASGASSAERDLLAAGANVEPPDGARAAALAALMAKIGTTGTVVGGTGLAVSTTTKLVGGLFIVAALGGGVAVATRGSGEVTGSSAPPASVAATASTTVSETTTIAPPAPSTPPPERPSDTAEAHGPSAPILAPPPSASAPARTAPSPVHPTAGSPTPSASSSSGLDALRDEASLLGAAREALHRGDGRGALAVLETARARHPRGRLVQEREVLAIEALAQTGDAEGASRRATLFLQSFRESPHAAHVRTFVR